MTKHIVQKIIIISFIPFSFVACRPSERKVENAKQEVKEAELHLEQTKEKAEKINQEWLKYKAESEAKIRENERQIAILKAQIDQLNENMKLTYKNSIAKLEQRNNELKQNLNHYREEGKENWEKFKAEFNHDSEDLKKAIKNFKEDNVK